MSYERPYRIVWMNMKWINIHIAKMHLHHIWGADVCPVPFIPPHMEDTESQGAYQQSRTKGSLLVGGRGWMVWTWCLDEKFSLQLLLLCCTSPGGTATAVEGGDILWYIVHEGLGQNAKHGWWKSDILFKDHVQDTQKPAAASQSCTISLFISQDDCVIRWRAAKAP